MGLTHEALAERLRTAREACGLTQEAAAAQLGVSRPTLAQIEAANRKVTGLELVRLARLYGRAITDLVADEFEPAGEPVLFRALPEVRSDPRVGAAVRVAMALVREILALRGLLGTGKTDPGLPVYHLPRLTTRWHAVEMGNRLAALERQRLGLGLSPVPDLAALVESQGALVLEMELPQAVSGFTFRPNGAAAFAIHARQAPVRQRFSLAHEYCHALCDWGPDEGFVAADGKAIVCRAGDAAELGEVRANAFAAAFLLPGDGVRSFLANLGKGSPSRPVETVFAEGQPGPYPTVEGRLPPHSQDIGVLEITLLADYFKVSRECATWRLFNLRLLGERERDRMLAVARGEAEDPGHPAGPFAASFVAEVHPAGEVGEPLRLARRMLLMLAHEALRREEISAGKFRELAEQAGLDEAAIGAMVSEIEGTPQLEGRREGRRGHLP